LPKGQFVGVTKPTPVPSTALKAPLDYKSFKVTAVINVQDSVASGILSNGDCGGANGNFLLEVYQHKLAFYNSGQSASQWYYGSIVPYDQEVVIEMEISYGTNLRLSVNGDSQTFTLPAPLNSDATYAMALGVQGNCNFLNGVIRQITIENDCNAFPKCISPEVVIAKDTYPDVHDSTVVTLKSPLNYNHFRLSTNFNPKKMVAGGIISNGDCNGDQGNFLVDVYNDKLAFYDSGRSQRNWYFGPAINYNNPNTATVEVHNDNLRIAVGDQAMDFKIAAGALNQSPYAYRLFVQDTCNIFSGTLSTVQLENCFW